MEAGNILSADVLDIIFDARNKEYGAYDLRKHYQPRLVRSFVAMLLIVILLLVAYMLVAAIKPATIKPIEVKEIDLTRVADKKKPDLLPSIPQPQKPTASPQVKMIRDMVPVIVKQDVPEDEKVPEQSQTDDAKIGTANVNGTADADIVAPVDDRKGIGDIVKKQNNDDEIWGSVEIESQYPGGMAAWSKFLYQHLTFPQEAADIKVEGTVMIQFVVDTEGNVSDVAAVSGPEELRGTAINVIKKSGKWTPAVQNGRQVKSYKRQPITFRLPDEQ